MLPFKVWVGCTSEYLLSLLVLHPVPCNFYDPVRREMQWVWRTLKCTPNVPVDERQHREEAASFHP